MTLEEQLRFFDRKADQAYARSLRDFKSRKDCIIAEARSRLIAGHQLYGGIGFGYPFDQLRQEELEEHADAVNYSLMRLWQGWT